MSDIWNDIPAGVPSFNVADLPPKIEPQVQDNPDFKGLPVRAGGDMVFILKGGKKHWVSSPEAFSKLGFKFGDEVTIDQATLNIIPEGEPVQ